MKVVLIGHGMVADTHVAAVRASRDLDLIGILGRDARRATVYAARHCSDAVVYATLDDLCASEPDFAIVATPPNARVDVVTALSGAGIPILMEKPVERTLAAARSIVSLCEGANIPAAVVFQHRMRDASQALKAAVDDGVLGEIVAAEIRVPWWRDQTYYDQPGRGEYARDGGGVMINQAIHTLDLAIWLLGPITSVQAQLVTTALHRMEAEDWAGALLRFASGAVATMTATVSFFPGTAESLSLQGTKAHARLENGVLTIDHLDGRRDVLGASAEGTGGGADPMAFTHIWHQAVIEDFADALQSNRKPICPVQDALAAHAVIEAMEGSSRTERTTLVETP